MKHEWKKTEKQLYLPGRKPEQVEIPTQKFFCVSGKGDPNEQGFSDDIAPLYALTYSILMMPKKGIEPEGYYPYALYPLEGVWTLDAPPSPNAPLDKSSFVYQIMIRQPEFVDEALFMWALEAVRAKKEVPANLKKAQFVEINEGSCVQMMHHGSFDDEPASFAQMDAFLAEAGLERRDMAHREIYMSDPRKTKPENRRTVLRYTVRPAGSSSSRISVISAQ